MPFGQMWPNGKKENHRGVFLSAKKKEKGKKNGREEKILFEAQVFRWISVTLSILFSIFQREVENCKGQTIIEMIPERIIFCRC